MKRQAIFFKCIFLIIILISISISCKKSPSEKNESADEITKSVNLSETAKEDRSSTKADEEAPENENTPAIVYNSDYEIRHNPPMNIYFETEQPFPSAHKKYLNESMAFKAVPDQYVKAKRTAVVGSDVCYFYPKISLKTDADLNKLKKGTLIPFGTILAIDEKPIENEDKTEHGTSLFHFEENQNWFYTATWLGKEGMVFGSDLEGLDADPEQNKITALLYKTNGVFDSFYPITGYKYLSEEQQETLIKDKLIFQKVSKNEYYLGTETPDDMISLYQNYGVNLRNKISPNNEKTPIFITTDLISHSKHLIFDKAMQDIEEQIFIVRLKDLTDIFLKELEKVNTENFITAPEETKTKAVFYFQTAKALLETAPIKKENEYSSKSKGYYVYEETDKNKIIEKYPEAVQEEVELILNAAGSSSSPVFTFENGKEIIQDYSRYIVRGHYTKNGILSTYFRTMLWFSSIDFPMTNRKNMSGKNFEAVSEMQAIGLLIAEITKSNQTIFTIWSDIYNPISDIVGLSDDLSFYDLIPFLRNYNIGDFNTWVSNEDNLMEFRNKAEQNLKKPFMNSSAMSWKLFGQRFVFDSYIQEEATFPNVEDRFIPSGLDVMKVLGSKAADKILASSEYEKYPGLKENLTRLQNGLMAEPGKKFGQTYYSTVLNEIALQVRFEKGAGFYFTESEAWNKKALLSAHGTWAELRHDTLLYAVMGGVAECGGDGIERPTFRTKPIPEPIHYIEPNLPFWRNAALSIKYFASIVKQYKLIRPTSIERIESFAAICDKAASITEKEIQNKNISLQDIRWIPTIANELAKLVLEFTHGYVDDKDELKMALIADVFKIGSTSLQVGTGIPYRIYVPLNDAQGGKRIAVGYCFSYYEFLQPSNDLYTDKTWKGLVYNYGELEDKKPEWSKNIMMPAE
ncbi:DUF3160 domain-containing protein [Treponema denticola]|uniref:Lipoprotein n=1 Tax=Treponema denticola SP33 TaxID=999437 RepID=M2AAQ1_TREDN|nr:DUF3160 domain-containing protein [Treponema denticola]EMB19531.1 hypothetical protein HMPREF9733_02631 [Treponema denticola SP33]EPF38082.1 hypothetical protein HMPREF9732_00046 [Treponema denticola SP32]